MKNNYRENIKLSILTLLSFIFLWELLPKIGNVQTQTIPPPSVVFQTFLDMLRSGEFLSDVLASLSRVFVGFLAAAFSGILLGVFTGKIRQLKYTLGLLIQLFRPIPAIAIIPFVISWIGIGENAKYFLVFWGVFFPVWINTSLGISHIEEKYIWAAESLGVKGRKKLFEIILPAMAPSIIAGMRIGIAIAFIMLVAAEMAGATKGLGFRIDNSHLVFRTDKMIVALITLGVLGATADYVFSKTVDKFFPWYKATNNK